VSISSRGGSNDVVGTQTLQPTALFLHQKGRTMTFLKRFGLLLSSTLTLFIGPAKAASGSLTDGTFDGAAYDAYYGPVQVELRIKGGRIIDATAVQSPNHRRTSLIINRQALPYLRKEVIQAQSGNVDAISGATLTSSAYSGSASDAIRKASK
jgi:uncharacterized protein with FMN-binding domain